MKRVITVVTLSGLLGTAYAVALAFTIEAVAGIYHYHSFAAGVYVGTALAAGAVALALTAANRRSKALIASLEARRLADSERFEQEMAAYHARSTDEEGNRGITPTAVTRGRGTAPDRQRVHGRRRLLTDAGWPPTTGTTADGPPIRDRKAQIDSALRKLADRKSITR